LRAVELLSSLTWVAGLNIAALSRRTGVGTDTLRKWEQRYGVLRPTRTPGGQRRYSELDVQRVEWLCARLGEGYRIGEAARLLSRSTGEAPATPPALRTALVEAVGRSDGDAIEELLDQAFALRATDEALSEIVRPVLQEVGHGWAAGAVSVAQEHLVSQLVRAKLQHLLSDRRSGVRGEAVLACVPGEQHELGLLMLAVCLRADGWSVVYLGADTPVADALALARARETRLLALSVTMPEHVAAFADALLAAELPVGLRVIVGGASAGPPLARVLGVTFVQPELQAAVAELRELAA